MVYSDTTNYQGIVQDIDYLCETSAYSYAIQDKTRNANRALDEIFHEIIKVDNNWKFDDANNTTFPIATTNIVSGQNDYSYNSEVLAVATVEAKDSSGNWYRLTLREDNQLDSDESLSALAATNGLSEYYMNTGGSIVLYPTPNTSITAGLKVTYKRKMGYFATTDTTKEPGFASHLHRAVSFYCAADWCLARASTAGGQDPRGANYWAKYQEYLKKIREFYVIRNEDTDITMTTENINSV